MDLSYTVPAVIALGALHSLEPGHGKGIITAYLISTGAKVKDAVIIGIVSALAHTLSIALLALSASTALQYLLPKNITSWIQLLSGVVVIYIGLNMISQRLFPQKESSEHHSDHDHHHGHCKHENHGEHLIGGDASLKNLLIMGFFTGLIPCPSALAILLAAVSAGEIPLGLGLVGAFSIGSAITMVAIGLLVVRSSKAIKKLERWNVLNRLAIVSSFLVLFLGAVVILHSLNHI